MKAIERPAKNIFSQQKKDKIFEKNYKSAMEKTLAPIVSVNRCFFFLNIQI